MAVRRHRLIRGVNPLQTQVVRFRSRCTMHAWNHSLLEFVSSSLELVRGRFSRKYRRKCSRMRLIAIHARMDARTTSFVYETNDSIESCFCIYVAWGNSIFEHGWKWRTNRRVERTWSIEETERSQNQTSTKHLESGGHVDSLNLGVMLACTPGPSGHHNLFEWANATVVSTVYPRKQNARDEIDA